MLLKTTSTFRAEKANVTEEGKQQFSAPISSNNWNQEYFEGESNNGLKGLKTISKVAKDGPYAMCYCFAS